MKSIYLLYGGKSAEHEISVLTAKSIINNLDRKKYKIFPIYVDKSGRWNYLGENFNLIENEKELIVEGFGSVAKSISNFFEKNFENEEAIFFPAMHGTFSEDGTIQGFFDIMDLTYVGNNVLSSAVCMDKVTANDIFASNGILQPKYYLVTKYEFEKEPEKQIENILEKIGESSFIKPCNAGSSVGVTKVNKKEEIIPALLEAFKFDNRVLVEEAIIGDELQVLVVGNNTLKATLPGGVKVTREFFDYEAKYLDETTDHIIPWDLSEDEIKEIQSVAKKAYAVTNCKGFARVDIFVRDSDRKMLVNEINTIPGMTSVSMAPAMYMKSFDKTYGDFLDELIELAIENKKEKMSLVTNRG
ncbi:MAG: D-alanine--D-alanine ligase [Peptoniphilaceae bacterium]|uniref:D-alanine--D-alanine ligase family protein n=1 Tax=Parvimonas sp. TaxID=1944660 RepID=UPI002A753DB6|nr:D-alanine--D-alanine ligase family protein [Parvimonas sp.]MDD7764224.1 D-alanine--D-alanine ligase [Peptoniphilaceae bacterium]MDY3050430.1 D-alanine--D-alanine ligase family protein [Parvimonas sp.]